MFGVTLVALVDFFGDPFKLDLGSAKVFCFKEFANLPVFVEDFLAPKLFDIPTEPLADFIDFYED